MASVSQSIPALLGGVSQQADAVKLPGQVREAENVYLDPTFGCVKRHPTRYIAQVATDIPQNAKWFPIFRDNEERYLACVYNDPELTPKIRFRVFEADSGVEREVLYDAGVEEYIEAGKFANLKFLTINDYTFVVNPTKRVSMSSNRSDEAKAEALVVINQVGYNTTYQVDFLDNDEEMEKVKVRTATEIQVNPGSWDGDDEDGSCDAAGVQEYIEDNGLKYRLTVNCTPTQVTTYEEGEAYPTQVALQDTSDRAFADWAAITFGSPLDVALNAYAYQNVTMQMDDKSITIRVEARCVKICTWGQNSEGQDKNRVRWALSTADVVSYSSGVDKKSWRVGADGDNTVTADFPVDAGYSESGIDVCDSQQKVLPEGDEATIRFEVIATDRGPKTPVYTYKSVYNSSVQLLAGGTDVRRGDTYTQTFKGKEYTVKITEVGVTYNYKSDNSVSYTTPTDTTAGPLNVGQITGALIADINDLDGYEAEGIGNIIKITRTKNVAFNISARGGSTDNAMFAIKGSVNDISFLPTVGFDDVILKVQNSQESDADDYYVKFITTGGIPGAGSWEECAKPGIRTTFNASTMPHTLVRQSNGKFRLQSLASTDEDEDVLAWANRTVGDDETNPVPSFVGQRINNMVFHMNRLGFLSNDTVIMSQAGDYFNFFSSSALAFSEADPIDMACTSTRPANLMAGVSTAEGLVLFSSDAQFLMHTKDVSFGPSSVMINQISSYSFASSINPEEVGTSIFFNSNSTKYSKVFEMATQSVTEAPQVAEDTRVIPEYIPQDLKWCAPSPNNNFIAYGDTSETVWTFKFFNQGNERSLAGWSKWTFANPVQFCSFMDDVGYFVFYNEEDGSSVFASMNLADDPEKATIWVDDRAFEPRIDLYASNEQVTVATDLVDPGITRVYLPDGTYSGQERAIIQFNKSSGTYFVEPEILLASNGKPYAAIPTDAIAKIQGFNIGVEYLMYVELPTFFVKEQKRVDRYNIPVVESVHLEMYLSGSYDITLKRLGYDDNVQYIDSIISDVYLANSSPVVIAESRSIQVFCRGDLANIEIRSTGALPAGIAGYSWQGHYNTRGVTNVPM